MPLSPSQTGVTFTVSRWLFVRLLGVIYLIAFSSLGVQILGLVGEQGILPARDFLDRAWAAWGTKALFQLPSLFWISTSDQAVVGACWAGAALSGATDPRFRATCKSAVEVAPENRTIV